VQFGPLGRKGSSRHRHLRKDSSRRSLRRIEANPRNDKHLPTPCRDQPAACYTAAPVESIIVMRRKLGQLLGVSTFAIFIALSVLVAASFWNADDPRPQRAMVLALSYCLVMMGVCALLAFVLGRLGAPPVAGGPPEPPAGSPVGVPIGPRRPRPLVAHAVPAVESDA